MQKIYILGSGALGCLWAARLAPHFDVRFLSSPDHANRKGWHSAQSGTAPQLPAHRFRYQQSPAPDVQPGIELSIERRLINAPLCDDALILLTTKSYDALAAAEACKPFLNSSHQVVLFQNGLGSQQEVCAALEHIPCFAAVSTEAANIPEPGLLVHAATGTTTFGALNQAAKDENLQPGGIPSPLTILAQSKLNLTFDDDIWRALWNKLAINCAINPFTAIANCRNGEVSELALFKELWPELKQELTTMMALAGYPCEPATLEQKVFNVIASTSENLSSMLQDRMANRQTEIDYINGFAARFLNQNGISCDANKRLTEQVHALGN